MRSRSSVSGRIMCLSSSRTSIRIQKSSTRDSRPTTSASRGKRCFPVSHLRRSDHYIDERCRVVDIIVGEWTGGLGMTPAGLAHSRQFYHSTSTISVERLLCVRREHGLGWDKLWPYVGVDIPKEGMAIEA